ncbi:glycoside hydrolase family protein [Salix suchowensis]|nr:glycoside hydrolase family protein [Salix suchowensis]
MAASQQAHIDQLVQQNRTLQYGVKKLHEELAAEQKRGQQVVQKIQEQWHAGIPTTYDGSREGQDNVLKERNRTRLEKVARLQRDFKITMFQARENELERQVEDLTLELQSLTTSKENEMAEKESSSAAALKRIKAEYAEYVAQAEADAAGYVEVEDERDQLQTSLSQEELGKLREEHARLKVSYDSSSTRLERATLQLEGSKSTIAALQQKNDELVRNVADLQHHLGKWQTLDVKGVEEIEIERKKRVESETRLMQLQGRLDQMEKKEAELSGLLEKEKRRTEKAKEAALEWKVGLTPQAFVRPLNSPAGHQAAAEGYEGDLATFEGQIAQLQNEITHLQTDLETERAISRPARARRVSQ